MNTWKEAREAKAARLRRERRYYTPDKVGRPCPICHVRMPLALLEAGENAHPTCGPNGVT